MCDIWYRHAGKVLAPASIVTRIEISTVGGFFDNVIGNGRTDGGLVGDRRGQWLPLVVWCCWVSGGWG
jgi:hypothetical protein